MARAGQRNTRVFEPDEWLLRRACKGGRKWAALFSVAAVSACTVTEGYRRATLGAEEKRMGNGAGISPSAWFPHA